jgi:hypothetical protein
MVMNSTSTVATIIHAVSPVSAVGDGLLGDGLLGRRGGFGGGLRDRCGGRRRLGRDHLGLDHVLREGGARGEKRERGGEQRGERRGAVPGRPQRGCARRARAPRLGGIRRSQGLGSHVIPPAVSMLTGIQKSA